MAKVLIWVDRAKSPKLQRNAFQPNFQFTRVGAYPRNDLNHDCSTSQISDSIWLVIFPEYIFLANISNCRKMLSWSCQFISRNVHTNAVCLSSDKLMERRLFMGTSRYLVFISTSPNGVWHATASLWQLWYNVTMSQRHNVTMSPCHDNTMS